MSKDEAAPDRQILLDRARAELLLDLLTQCAAKGPQATTLGGLHDQVKRIVDYHWPPVKNG
jgi:hypothetical protein